MPYETPAPFRRNYDVHAGSSLRDDFVWRDPAGEPIDLTGWSGRMVIGDGDEQAVVLSTATQGVTLGPAGAAFHVRPADTAALGGRVLRYDLLVTSPDLADGAILAVGVIRVHPTQSAVTP